MHAQEARVTSLSVCQPCHNVRTELDGGIFFWTGISTLAVSEGTFPSSFVPSFQDRFKHRLPGTAWGVFQEKILYALVALSQIRFERGTAMDNERRPHT